MERKNDNNKNIKKEVTRLFQKNNFSFYRFYVFITSKNGWVKLFILPFKIVRKLIGIAEKKPLSYENWFNSHSPSPKELKEFKTVLDKLDYHPKISVIIPLVKNPLYIKSTIQSIVNQLYENWVIHLLVDASYNKEMITQLTQLTNKIIIENDLNLNHLIKKVTGEYVTLIQPNDLLTKDAFFQKIRVLNQDQTIDFIYSDEDVIDENNRINNPKFKPDWSPDELLSRNYIGYLSLISKSIINVQFSSYDELILKTTSQAQNICHLPNVLYHNRLLEYVNQIKTADTTINTIRYEIVDSKKVSVIIPTKNRADITGTCLESIFNYTDYTNYEVILIDNNSTEKSFFELVEKWKNKEPNRFKCIKDEGDFNFSRLNNSAVEQAKGDYILLLNNDTKVIHKDWMTAMVEQVQRDSIGAVGAKLLYEDNTIQHAGVVIGLDQTAGHIYEGFDANGISYLNNINTTKNYSAVTAACLMVRKEVYKKVNGLDEDFAVGFNDVDFCLKLKEKGYNNIYLPHVSLYHYGSQSRAHPHLNKSNYERHYKEINMFKEKWKKYIVNDPGYNQNLSLRHNDSRLKV